ncbi:MAG: hypothetical protein EAZ16_04785 [Sphingobacteriales bacterium]|nr:MAG: hypothetical protein EAZ16_04785 [Sphingobacteriales bacterium]
MLAAPLWATNMQLYISCIWQQLYNKYKATVLVMYNLTPLLYGKTIRKESNEYINAQTIAAASHKFNRNEQSNFSILPNAK